MLNPYHNYWVFRIGEIDELPTIGREVYILVEHDVIDIEDDPLDEYPFVRKAKLMNDIGPTHRFGLVHWELLDAVEEEDKILHQDVTVIAWRYVSDNHS